MEVYVKESLHVLDYLDNIVDTIFLSDDHRTAGYAFSINVEEANTGYSNLTFQMPNTIINKEGQNIKNPKLSLLKPLVKLRYHREVFYMGEKEITVKEPVGYGDTTVYVDRTYKNTYPDNVIENYVMDYIVQPIEKKRSNMEISTSFNAIDYPRFNLSKKKFGLTINDDTITREDWSIFTREPMSIPGTVEYIPWSKTFGYTDMEEWDPSIATQYPLTEPQINNMLKQTGLWTYGLATTVYYWPITNNGRFEGTIYSKGDYLTLHIYPKTQTGSLDNDWSQTVEKSGLSSDVVFTGDAVGPTSLDFCGYEWTYLEKGAAFLTPNNACNYLLHTLVDTNWTVKYSSDRYCGTYFNTANFPVVRTDIKGQSVELKENDYLILKEPNTEEEDYSKYMGRFNSVEELPQSYNETHVGRWAIVTTQGTPYINNTVVWVWSGTEWNYNYDDKYLINTKFYAWRDGAWTDVTKEYWTGAIDKKTGVLYDVDTVETEVPTLKTNAVAYETTELRSSLSASESNCYNVITSICKEFQLYPIFDCINRTVSLKLFSGKNYGLQYVLGGSLSTSGTKSDGEKVITKLRCFGGQDVQGTEVINLGEANRKYKQYNAGLYASVGDLPVESVKGYWAVVGDMTGEHYWEYTGIREVYEYKNNAWHLVPPTEDENGKIHYYVTTEDGTFDVDLETGMSLPWDPNDPAYIQKRSPYGTEYIYNFKWMYDNGWMSKEQILGVYEKSTELQTLNKGFLENYDTDYVLTYDTYIDAGVNYQANDDEFQACINAMANKYYYNPQQPNEGSFVAFPYVPSDTYLDKATGYHYLDVHHCKNLQCRYAQVARMTTCPKCGSEDIQTKPIRIPCWDDYNNEGATTSDRLSPSSKGFYQQVIETIGDGYRSYVKVGTQFPTNEISETERTFCINGNANDKDNYVWDKSGVLYNWNDYVAKWVEYWGYAQSNLIELNAAQERVNLLEQSYKIYETKRDKIDFETQDQFGDYIVEGKYKDDTIVYTEILLSESLKASDKYCIPEITYNLNVIDTSGLCEYRGHHDEVYNDLVHALHNVGQIVPKPGDYCSIYDEPMGLLGVPGLITNIKRVIDNPVQNSITIDTAYTDADDLVGNIINATNTVLNHADVYARTAILQSDGTITAAAMNETLEKSSKENISLVGVKGSSFLDSTGLVVTDPKNPNYKLKYGGAGVYGTVDNEETWFSMMTPAGINANYINAGSIDTQNVHIMSGKSAKVVLDNLGLSVKDKAAEAYNLPTSKDAKGYWNWSNTNLKAFIGVNRENEGLLYLDGQMQVRGGSKIAGWEIDDNRIYKDDVWMSSTGSEGTVNGTKTNYNFYSNGKFGVDTDGILYATGAKIKGSGEFTGKIVVTTDDSSVNNGTVGGWKASDSGLKVTGIELSPTGGTQHTVNGRTGSDWALWANDNFGVTTSGNLYATSADISGKIKAGSGEIGGWTIGTNDLHSTNVQLRSQSGNTVRAIEVNNGTFYVQNNGYLRSTSGKIGNWVIGSTSITNGNTTLGSSGKISFSSGSAFFAMGNGSDHPVASALSVRDSIAFWSSLTDSGGGTYQGSLLYDGENIAIRPNGDIGTYIGAAEDERISINGSSKNITMRTDHGNIYLRPQAQGSGKGLFIYDGAIAGSYCRGKTGYLYLNDEDNITGLDKIYAVFINGILCGVYETKPSSYTNLKGTTIGT